MLALHRTTHYTLHALSSALADLNLTAAEINALANLADRGALNVRELSAETGTRTTTLTGVLDRLENRGYLTRELDATDRRSFRLPLTEAGQVGQRVDLCRGEVQVRQGAAQRVHGVVRGPVQR